MRASRPESHSNRQGLDAGCSAISSDSVIDIRTDCVAHCPKYVIDGSNRSETLCCLVSLRRLTNNLPDQMINRRPVNAQPEQYKIPYSIAEKETVLDSLFEPKNQRIENKISRYSDSAERLETEPDSEPEEENRSEENSWASSISSCCAFLSFSSTLRRI